MEESEESISIYEVYAVYAIDYATGARIEQIFDITAPTDIEKQGLTQIIADETGRMTHDIEQIDIVSTGVRQHLDSEDIGVFRKGRIELGGI